MKTKTNLNTKKREYYFFLNPYEDCAFSRCPKCDNRTKQKKLPLVIITEKDKRILSLNKICRYCPFCYLLIAKKSEIDYFISACFGKQADYFVAGTMERSVWKTFMPTGNRNSRKEALENTIFFIDVWNFGVQPAGWTFDKDK